MSTHKNSQLPYPTSDSWENAFFDQYQAAAIGHMFQGILHNLNGVTQAFSLQAALFKSMFTQAEELCVKIQNAEGDETREYTEQLNKLLCQRAVMVDHMETKFGQCQDIIKRSLPLADLYDNVESKFYSVNNIVKYEIEILSSISFFKHEVNKSIKLSDNLPYMTGSFQEVHNTVYAVLLNAIESAQDSDNPEILIQTDFTDGEILISVQDSGSLFDIDELDNFFLPFYSTKEGHLGVGLYLAYKSINVIGGTISYSVKNGLTNCQISIPHIDVGS